MIECRNLTKKFGELTAVSNISLLIKEKEFISILGPSGCGKSTLLRLIAGLEVPSEGRVFLHEKEISGKKIILPPERRQFGMIFQDFALFPHLSVEQNIAFGIKGKAKDKKQRVKDLLKLVNLTDLTQKMPHQISGGEQQRIAVARALAPRPRLILMDEPFSNLDFQLRQQLRNDIREILRYEGVATILVTHDQVEAVTFPDRVILMHHGELVQSGTPEEIYQLPQTVWASSFMGETNHLRTEWANNSLKFALGFLEVSLDIGQKTSTLMIRPEDFLVKNVAESNKNGVIKSVDFSGPFKILKIELNSGETIQVNESAHVSWSPGDSLKIDAKRYICYDSAGQRLSGFLPKKSK